MGTHSPRDAQSGVFTPSFSDADLLSALQSEDSVLAKDIASQFDCTTRNARIRLNRLVEKGQATVEMVGPTKIYHPVDG